MSLVSSHAFNMSQHAYTTVSRVEPSPASAAAMASSMKREPDGDVALADADQPELCQGDQLEIDVAGDPGHVECPLR